MNGDTGQHVIQYYDVGAEGRPPEKVKTKLAWCWGVLLEVGPEEWT